MDQETELTVDQVYGLLQAMEDAGGRSAVIDWANRTIRVLSDLRTHPTKVLSGGPMQWRDILHEVRGR